MNNWIQTIVTRMPAPLGAAAIFVLAAFLLYVAPTHVSVNPSQEAASAADAPQSPLRAATDTQAALAMVLERPLFHRDRRPTQAIAANAELPSNYKLEGTVVVGDVRRALILNTADMASGARWYELGEMVGDWRVKSIEPGSVGLSHGERSVTLTMGGVKETLSIMSIQQRSATPIYQNELKAPSREEFEKRRAALEASYPATADQQPVRRE